MIIQSVAFVKCFMRNDLDRKVVIEIVIYFILVLLLAYISSKILFYCMQKAVVNNKRLLIEEFGVMEPLVGSFTFIFVNVLLVTYYLLLVYSFTEIFVLALSSLLFLVLLAISIIDWRYQFIFDEFLLVLLGLALWGMVYRDISVWQCLLNSLLGLGGMLILAWISKGGMGGGDIKMTAVLGLMFTPMEFFHMITLAFVMGACVGIILLACKMRTRKDKIAFAPYLSLASILFFLKGLI